MTLALLALAVSAAVPAAPAAGASPVRIEAAELRHVYPKRQTIFTGEPREPVKLTRGDATLTCQRLVAQNDVAGQVLTATCSGDVRLVRGQRIVTCETATFDNAAARVTCAGNPVLRDGGSTARGELLVYDLAKDEVKLEKPAIEIPPEQLGPAQKTLEGRRRGARP